MRVPRLDHPAVAGGVHREGENLRGRIPISGRDGRVGAGDLERALALVRPRAPTPTPTSAITATTTPRMSSARRHENG